MKRLFLFIILIAIVGASPISAQQERADLLEKEINDVVLKSYKACVRIFIYDTEKKQKEEGGFSGVVVSKEGHILTAAHAVDADKTYLIRFPDGREVLTQTLGRIEFDSPDGVKYDIAMLKITQSDDWPFAEMAWSYSLKLNDPAISISYPGNLNQDLPTLRFGRILQLATGGTQIKSSCKMEPGDSGGPLFDRFGRVIAIHSSVGRDINDNFENPIDLYRKYWDALNIHTDYKVVPDIKNEVGVDPLFNNTLQALDASPETSRPIKIHTGVSLHISSTVTGKKSTIVGTVFVTSTQTLIVSKSSMVGENPQALLQRVGIELEIITRDTENDLVLMSLSGKLRQGIHVDSFTQEPRNLDLQSWGKILVSALPDSRKMGVLGSSYLNLPRLYSSGVLSLDVKNEDDKLLIENIIPNSTAAKAGLLIGDQIIMVNDKKLVTIKDLIDEIILHDPGEEIEIGLIRNDNRLSLKILLTHWPVGRHAGEQFAGGRSVRADGFEKVFVQDAEILSTQCGSPVFDVYGEFVGMNIARFSRTITLVMPSEIVWTFIEPYL